MITSIVHWHWTHNAHPISLKLIARLPFWCSMRYRTPKLLRVYIPYMQIFIFGYFKSRPSFSDAIQLCGRREVPWRRFPLRIVSCMTSGKGSVPQLGLIIKKLDHQNEFSVFSEYVCQVRFLETALADPKDNKTIEHEYDVRWDVDLTSYYYRELGTIATHVDTIVIVLAGFRFVDVCVLRLAICLSFIPFFGNFLPSTLYAVVLGATV